MDFTLYKIATGEIIRSGFCADDDIGLQAGEGEAVITNLKVADDVSYIVGGSPASRPSLGLSSEYSIPADGIAKVEFGLPEGSTICCLSTGEEWADEAEFSMTSEISGDHVYRIEPPFPWRGPIEVTIHAA